MIKKTALIIDHDDSFIWNIKFWLEPEFSVTLLNHSQLKHLSSINDFDLIIMSPGPKSPLDYPESLKLIQEIKTPILGICLGFQMLTLVHGGRVLPYTPPKHGKTSTLTSNRLQVGRYHSLKCEPSDDFKIIALSADDHCVMWAEHRRLKQIGFQFHPESFLTENAGVYKKHLMDWISV